ncbi:MAG: hypothetical protein ABC537_00195 [Candidatus Methanosuratincola sp.]
MKLQDAYSTDLGIGQTLLLHGHRNAARGVALRACIEKVRLGGRALYLQQRLMAVDETALRSMVGPENLMLGIFDSLGEVAPLISEIKPAVAVIDPVNGLGNGYLSRRRLALDLFEMATAAGRIKASLILLCDMTERKGAMVPRHYSLIRKFCDSEMEVRIDGNDE